MFACSGKNQRQKPVSAAQVETGLNCGLNHLWQKLANPA